MRQPFVLGNKTQNILLPSVSAKRAGIPITKLGSQRLNDLTLGQTGVDLNVGLSSRIATEHARQNLEAINNRRRSNAIAFDRHCRWLIADFDQPVRRLAWDSCV